MAAHWEQFRDGAAGKGFNEDTAKEVFRKLMGFASYGFPHAHAASFAVLAYQSAWLKYHHPAAFTCALFNNQPMGFYPPHVIVNDARRAGVRVRPPDINVSAMSTYSRVAPVNRKRCSLRSPLTSDATPRAAWHLEASQVSCGLVVTIRHHSRCGVVARSIPRA